MLLRVQVCILKSATIHLKMHLIEEHELITLEFITHEHFDNVVLMHKCHDLLSHLKVALNIV